MPDDVLRLRADLAEARIDVQALAQKVRVERSDADSPRAQLAEALAEHQSLLDKHNALHISARAARDEAEALRKDAERYRWLRTNTDDQIPFRGWWQIAGGAGADQSRLDAAIDAAMGGQKEASK